MCSLMGMQCKLAAASHAAELTSSQAAVYARRPALSVAGHAAQLSHKLA